MTITYPMYLVGYSTEIAAKNRSHEAAIQMGCNPDDVTQYWFPVLKHPNRDEWAMLIHDNVELLTIEEQALLVTEEIVRADGWFDMPSPPES